MCDITCAKPKRVARRWRRWLEVVGGVAWLLAASGRAAGQARDTLMAGADTGAVRLAPIVVTASRLPLRVNRVGVPVTLVTFRDLELRRPASALEALRGEGGVFVDEAAGPGGPAIVRLRGGEEVFTQILVDGVRVNQNGGFFDFQGLTLSGLDRIEVVRGPQSAMYGSSAVSGVVQFLSRTGERGPVRLSVGAEGSGATVEGGGYRGSAELSGGTSRVQWAGEGGLTYSRGIYALPNDTKTREGSFRLDASPTDAWSLDWVLRFVGVDSKLPVRDPGATRVALDPNARNTRDRLVTAVTARYSPTARWQHRLRTSFYGEDFVYDDRRDGVTVPNDEFFVFDADFNLDSRLVRPVVEYSSDVRFGDAMGRGGALSVGGSWERERLREKTGGEFGEGRQVLQRTSGAGFAELQLRPASRVDLLAGVRVEKYEGLVSSLTPRASAVFRLAPGFAVRLAAGRAYKAPNLQEQFLDNPFIVSNPDLAPETSTSYEAGLDLRAGSRLTGGVTVFRQEFDDLIRSVDLGDGTGRQQNRNLGSSRAEGIEWQAEYHAARWTARTSGAWLTTEILDATGLPAESFPQGEPLPFRPSVVGVASLEVAVTPRLRVLARTTIAGSQTVLSERFSGRRVELDPYALAGLTVNWDATSRWQLYARFDNLLDTAYETAYDRRGIPTTAAIGFRWRNR